MRGLALLASVLGALLVVPAALAASGIRITSADTSGYPRVRVTVVTDKPSAVAPMLTEGGAGAAGLQAENLGRAKAIVLAIDRSQSMKGAPLARASAAARAFVRAKPQDDEIAVTTFATKAVMLTGFSTSTIDADAALQAISVDPKQGTTLYDDVVLAAGSLARRPLPARVIILVTDGNETRSEASLAGAIEAARKARAALYVVAIESARFTPKPLRELAAKTGGRYYGAHSSSALKSIYQAIARELRRTWRLEDLTSAQPGESPVLTASLPGLGSASRQFVIPKSATRTRDKSVLPDSAFGAAGQAVLAMAVGGLVLLGYGFVFATRRADRVRSRVEPHVVRSPKKRPTKKVTRNRLQSVQHLFEATERALGQTRYWRTLGCLIERADLPLKTAELAYMMAASGLVFGAVSALASAPAILGLLAVLVGGFLPFGFVSFKAKRRVAAFDNQLPDLLISMAASLKAGHSFKSGLQAVVDEGYEPAGKEFKRVLTETRLGRPLDAALADMAERIGSPNLTFIVTAVSVQMQVGGSMAGLFEMVGDTVRSRQQFARKIKALTAMGRMSAYVLCAIPFFIAGALTLLNPEYMAPLYHSSTGQKLVLLTLVMMGIGALALRKIVSFKG